LLSSKIFNALAILVSALFVIDQTVAAAVAVCHEMSWTT
jgi:hypothetical protein